jgi:hypothetical protein
MMCPRHGIEAMNAMLRRARIGGPPWLAAVAAVATSAAGVAPVAGSPSAFAAVRGVQVDPLARALEQAPAQVVGSPSFSLSPGEVRTLRAEIRRTDPGRIWVAVTPALSQRRTSVLSNALSARLNADGGGTVIVVAGTNVWGSTSWEDGEAARSRLAAAFAHSSESLASQLRRAVDSFARGDAAADHPKLSAAATSTSPPATTASPGTTPAPTPTQASGGARPSTGGGVGLIVGLVAVGVALVVAAAIAGPRLRHRRRAAHRRDEERQDLKNQTQSDFGKLGDAIEALDIDSSMPNASARGKEEYAAAIECYQDAERRLRTPDDDYQFERAVEAITRGLAHVHAADQLFNPPSPARE